MFNQNNTILSGLSRPVLQQMLSDAQTAYTLLLTGGKPVSVSYDGKAVTYTAANSAELVQYIGLIQRCLGVNRGRRALRPYFR